MTKEEYIKRSEELRALVEKTDEEVQKLLDRLAEKDLEPGSREFDRIFMNARTRTVGGKYDVGMQMYGEAKDIYKSLGDLAGEFYCYSYIAMCYREFNKSNEAREALRHAYSIAMEMNDSYSSFYVTLLSISLYSNDGWTEEAEELTNKAKQMVDDLPYPQLVGNFYNDTAYSMIQLGRWEEALDYAKKANKACLEYYGREDAVNVLVSKINMTYPLVEMGRVDEALEILEELSKLMQGDRAESFKGAFCQISAEAYLKKGDYKKAYDYLEKYIEVQEYWYHKLSKDMNDEEDDIERMLYEGREEFRQNVIALDVVKQRLDILEDRNKLLQQIGLELTQTFDIDATFTRVAKDIAKTIDFDRVSMLLVDGIDGLDLPPLDDDLKAMDGKVGAGGAGAGAGAGAGDSTGAGVGSGSGPGSGSGRAFPTVEELFSKDEFTLYTAVNKAKPGGRSIGGGMHPVVELAISQVRSGTPEFDEAYIEKGALHCCLKNASDYLLDRANQPEQCSVRKAEEKSRKLGSAMFARLRAEQKVFGVLTVEKGEEGIYTEDELEFFTTIATFVSVATLNAKKHGIILDRKNQLERMSMVDPLTMLNNRRAFRRDMEELLIKEEGFRLLFMDMNHLKMINDNLGHDEGDRYLKKAAELLSDVYGEHGVYRISGDEFAVLMVARDREYLYSKLKELKDKTSEVRLREIPLALSTGIAGSWGKNFDQIYTLAESRMYIDKHDYYARRSSTLKRRK